MVTIEQLKEADPETLADLLKLSNALRAAPPSLPISLVEMKELLEDKNVLLLVAKDDTRIVGMATLYCVRKVGNFVSYVEDVVVGEEYRGKGIGEKLMLGLIDAAKTRGIRTISLTSRPERAAAQKLYEKLGFKKRETTPFRLELQ
jgi:ribosomal protein S18 acetylase RimI-like enzyme